MEEIGEYLNKIIMV